MFNSAVCLLVPNFYCSKPSRYMSWYYVIHLIQDLRIATGAIGLLRFPSIPKYFKAFDLVTMILQKSFQCCNWSSWKFLTPHFYFKLERSARKEKLFFDKVVTLCSSNFVVTTLYKIVPWFTNCLKYKLHTRRFQWAKMNWPLNWVTFLK